MQGVSGDSDRWKDVLVSQVEQIYSALYMLTTVLGTQNAFDLLEKVKENIISETNPNNYYGKGVIQELFDLGKEGTE